MEPFGDKTGVPMPQPASEQAAFGVGQPEMAATQAEMPAVAPLMAPPAMAPPTMPTAPAPVAPLAQQTSVAAAAVPADGDTDALDEEWINKAKAIVEQTRQDPHLETNELGKVKADYLRIRYNKHVKAPGEQA